MHRYSKAPDSRGNLQYIFDVVTSTDNLIAAHEKASRGRHDHPYVHDWDVNLFEHIEEVQYRLRLGTYSPSGYNVFDKQEGDKIRRIHSLINYDDRVIQWALILPIQDYLNYHIFTNDTYSAIKGRGQIKCMLNVRKAILDDPEGCRYYLKIDIHHYYQSIDHGLMKICWRNYFKDREFLKIIDSIIDSLPDCDGLPIGNLLSQYSGNLYLTEFDHYVKEKLKIDHYYRYMDDMVFFSNNKKKLHGVFEIVKGYLHNLMGGLKIKNNYQINELKTDKLDYVGYVIHGDGKILVRKRSKKRYVYRCNRCLKNMSDHNIASMEAGNGLVTYANSRGLQQKYHVPVVDKMIDAGKKNKKKKKLKTMVVVSLSDRLKSLYK